MLIRKTAVASAVAGALLTPLASPTQAQQAGADAVLDEIVVTARRREEDLQAIPLSITAFTGESLEARGIDMVGNMNAMAPNLSVQGGQGREIESNAAFRVRGVPGVAVYVDGIDQTSTIGLFTMGVVEVDRIEVLRGPQGTLFGNSALGGAVSYVTRKPAEEFGARVQTRVGTYDKLDIQASVDVPFGEKFLTKFTIADMSTEGYMQSLDSGYKYGDINDQFYRADLLFTPTDNLDIRYSYDRSEQNRRGGARAVWEIGPKNMFTLPTLPNPTLVNTNAHAQAYENAFGILYDDFNVSSGFPGGRTGEFETHVAHDTNGLQLDLDRQALDINWNITDSLAIRALAGDRLQTRRLMVDFDSDSRVFFADRQDNDEIDEQSYELQLLGTHDRFSWVVGYYSSDRTTKSRVPTYHGTPFVCDLIGAAGFPAASIQAARGVTNADRAECFNNRMRALGQPEAANGSMTPATIAAMWAAYTGAPNASQVYNNRGVTPAVLAGLVPVNSELIDITDFNTDALFADFSWNITDKLTLGVGAREQEDDNGGGTYQIRGTHLAEFQPWNDFGYDLRNPFGYTQVTSRGGAAEYKATTARVSAQYQFTDDKMAYITLSNGYQPGGVSQVPANILVLNAGQTAATGGLLRDVYNTNPAAVDLPYQLVRGEEKVDSFEIGLKADWADGRFRTNLTAFTTDWENMIGTTYVATVWWDLNGDTFAESRVPCAARCDPTNTWEVNYFPNLLNSGVLSAEASGIEIELTWAGGENYQLGFNTGLLDTEFIELGQAGEGTVPAFDEGDSFPGAPDMTANLWTQYDWQLGNGGTVSARFDYTWTDDYTTFAGGPLQRTQEAFGLLNARLVYDTGSNWSVLVAGTNLTDEYYSPAFFYTVSQQLWDGSVGRPREVYFGLNFSFE